MQLLGFEIFAEKEIRVVCVCVFFYVVQYLVTNVLKELSVSIFRAKPCSNWFLDNVDKHQRFSSKPKSKQPQFNSL